jgi:hypothetical protein
MKNRILIAFCAIFMTFHASSQIAVYKAKQLQAIDSIKLVNDWIKSISKDSAFVGVTDKDIPSALAVKKHLSGSLLGYVPITRTINGYPLSTNISLNKTDVGLGNVDNTSDANKPVSTAQAASIATKQATLVSGSNIKTVNSNNLLGSGDISVASLVGFTPENVANKNANNGYAGLDAGGKVPFSLLPATLMIYKGLWDATTNSPSLTNGVGTAGHVYKISNSGGQYYVGNRFGVVDTLWNDDFIIYNGSAWEVSGETNNVKSVNNQQGIVTLTTANIAENTNLYYTDARVLSYGNTQWVRSVSGTAGKIFSTGGSNPTLTIDAAYNGQSSITNVGTLTIGTWNATPITDTYISSAATWNAKQPQLNGTGFIKASGTTISYDNSTYLTTTGNGSGLTALPANTALYPTLNQNTTGTASNITAYTINQNLGTTSSPTFGNLTLTGALNGTSAVYSGELQAQYFRGTSTYELLFNTSTNANAMRHSGTALYVAGNVYVNGNGYNTGDVLATQSFVSTTYLPLSAGGSYPLSGDLHTNTGKGYYIDYNANAASRSWRVVSDQAVFGDFQIQQSTTQTGSTYTNALYFDASRNAQFYAGLGVIGNVGIGGSLTGSNANFTDAGTSDYILKAIATSGSGARSIFLAGKSGVSNGFTVSYNGTRMVYGMDLGDLSVGGSISGTSGSLSSTLGVSGVVTALRYETTLTGGQILGTANMGTSGGYMQVTNTGGTFYIGRESSSGSSFGASNYAAVLYSQGAYPLEIFTGGAKQFIFGNNGNLTIGNTSGTGVGDLYARNVFIADGFGLNAANFQIGGISGNRFYVYNNTLGIDNITIAPSTGITTFARGVVGTTAAFSGVGINATPISGGTSPLNIRFLSTGSDFYVGTEGSTGGGFFGGSSAYASVFYSGQPIQSIISGTKRLEVNSSGISVTGIGNFTSSVTASSFIKSGGTSSQILAGDGSVITAGSGITISGSTISASGGGTGTTYTPTISNGTGASATSLVNNPTYTVVGNVVTVRGAIYVTPTAASNSCLINMTLPLTASSTMDLVGTGSYWQISNSATSNLQISISTTTQASIFFVAPATVSAGYVYFVITYSIP